MIFFHKVHVYRLKPHTYVLQGIPANIHLQQTTTLQESRLGRLKGIMAQPTGQYVKSQPSQTTDVSVLRSFGPLFEFIITTLILDRTSYKGLYIEWISSKRHFWARWVLSRRSATCCWSPRQQQM